MSERRHEMPKPEEISALLASVSKELPGLVKGILDTFFSPQAAADIGKAVAAFYKNLKEGGIPEEQALAMTKEYLGTLTKWSEALRGMNWERRQRSQGE
jgi:predicted mannosyl-3-phosphoglycerate phosphatase (HAD superfamily)